MDPAPGTAFNEIKAQFHERDDYANKEFDRIGTSDLR